MNIEKVTNVYPKTTDGKVINVGDTVIFNADGRCFTGTFQGISKRGAVQIKGLILDNEVTFNVMPASIKEIYKADVNVRGQLPFEPNDDESEENADESL